MRAGLRAVRAIVSGPLWPLAAVSAAGWLAMAAMVASPPFARLCAAGHWRVEAGWAAGWRALALDWRLAAGWPLLAMWLAMLGAMMAPLLAQPLTWVREQSLSARRGRAAGLFALGYALPWIAAMAGLWALAAGLAAATRGAWAATGLAIGLALVWQGAPMKAVALRRCHRPPTLPAFGARAEWASFGYGLASAGWCVAACWAWMLVPLGHARGHLALMAAAFLIVLAERYARPPRQGLRPGWIVAGAALIAAVVVVERLRPPLDLT